jgi:YggT family protein
MQWSGPGGRGHPRVAVTPEAGLTRPRSRVYIYRILSAAETWKMFALGNLIAALAYILDMVLTIYMWVIIARALLTWVNPDPYNPIVRFLYNVTEPVLGWVRSRVPVVFGGLDLSPLLVLLGIVFLQRFLVATLIDLARRMG